MATPDARQKLRVGILLDSCRVPAWAYAMLEQIHRSDYAEITLIVLNDTPERPQSPLSSFLAHRHLLLYGVYQKLDDRLFRPRPDAFARRDLRDFLAGVPCMPVVPERSAHADRFTPEDLRRINEQDLDVLIRLGFRILGGDILRSAKLGVWSYHHGDSRNEREGPPGFWEVLENRPVTGSVVQILNEDAGAGLVLCDSFSATDPWSVKQSCNSAFWKSSTMLPRALRTLHRQGAERYLAETRTRNSAPPLYARIIRETPTNRELAPLLCRHLTRFLGHRLRHRFSFNQWNLLYDLHDGVSRPFSQYQRITPPKDRFWADPNVVFRDDSYYVFFEEVFYRKRRGRIAVLTFDRAGRPGKPITVLEPDYHVSYPFVFDWQNRTYMLLESSAAGRIQVFRCEEFPHRWVFHRNLIEDIAAVDGTLFQHQDKWWLFANVREREGASICDELFLFSADSPLSGSWAPHPMNPIVSDARRARPAGPLFLHSDAVYRPSQDCSLGYGHSLVLNRVTVLSEADYREEEVLRLGPDWDKKVRGLHTLSRAGRLTVIDAKFRRSRLF